MDTGTQGTHTTIDRSPTYQPGVSGQRPVGLGRDDRQLGCGAYDLAGKRRVPRIVLCSIIVMCMHTYMQIIVEITLGETGVSVL